MKKNKTLVTITEEIAKQIISKLGIDRIGFGADTNGNKTYSTYQYTLDELKKA